MNKLKRHIQTVQLEKRNFPGTAQKKALIWKCPKFSSLKNSSWQEVEFFHICQLFKLFIWVKMIILIEDKFPAKTLLRNFRSKVFDEKFAEIDDFSPKVTWVSPTFLPPAKKPRSNKIGLLLGIFRGRGQTLLRKFRGKVCLGNMYFTIIFGKVKKYTIV